MSESDSVKLSNFFDPEHPFANSGKRFIAPLSLLLAVVLYYLFRYSSGAQLLQTLRHVSPWYILIMALVEGLAMVMQGGILRAMYCLTGHGRTLFYSATMYVIMNLVNTVAPVVGLAGSVYMMEWEAVRGINRGDSLLINFLYYLTDYIVFLFVLLVGVIYLAESHQVSRTIIVTFVIYAIYVLFVLWTATTIFTKPNNFQNIVQTINKWLSRFLRKTKDFLQEEAITDFALRTNNSWLKSLPRVQKFLTLGGCAALGQHVFHISLLVLAFAAFHVPINLAVIIAGYSVGTMLNIVSITPSGLGFTEGGMTAVFVALKVPVEAALLVTLLYRIFYTWLPLAISIPSVHVLTRLGKDV